MNTAVHKGRAGWLVALGLLAGVLMGCGGAGGGTLQVDISGLPAGTTAAVTVAGPGGYTQTLTATGSLSGLAAGSYAVTAETVANYSPQVSGSPALVAAGKTSQVGVVYRSLGEGGSISGTLGIAVPEAADAPFVPGEVIVKFALGLRTQALGVQALARSAGLEPVRALPLEGVGLYRSSTLGTLGAGKTSGADEESATLRLVASLAARKDVIYAHPNYLLEGYATPNDPLYEQQWHYGAINLPSAWDRTTGSAGVTVAVLDSGILSEHPDLSPKLVSGYDFVSSASISGDGDGRDGDPADPSSASGYHGSHVAGTVAAATNNGVGVAGVSWGARILPVRVLGVGNGTLADAIDGILWSVGESVPGVPGNPNPAAVLNLSLGGSYACSEVPALQEAFETASATGAAITVAAGNSNVDASGVTPASCGGVITVGATNLTGKRASYSNYGARIDLMAPGGDLTLDQDGNDVPDGVLSTVRDDATGDYAYGYLDGTSMASPHVAGAIALLKSVRADLSGAEARDILMETAQPITDRSCTVGCGAGLIDVNAALAALAEPVTPDFALSVSPSAVELGTGESAEVALTLSRSGGFGSSVSFSVAGLPNGLNASFEPASTSGDSTVLTLSVAGSLTGTFALEVQATGGTLSRTRPLSVTVSSETPSEETDINGSYVYACPVAQAVCTLSEQIPAVKITTNGSSASYTIPNVPAGVYHVNAWKDLNNNGRVDAGEPSGSYLFGTVAAEVIPPASGIDIIMQPSLETQ